MHQLPDAWNRGLLCRSLAYWNSAISKTRAVPSRDTETRKSLLAETDRPWMTSEWPPKVLTQSPDRQSHIRTFPSAQPVARNLDSPSHVKQVTPSCPQFTSSLCERSRVLLSNYPIKERSVERKTNQQAIRICKYRSRFTRNETTNLMVTCTTGWWMLQIPDNELLIHTPCSGPRGTAIHNLSWEFQINRNTLVCHAPQLWTRPNV